MTFSMPPPKSPILLVSDRCCNKCSAVAKMGYRLATIGMSRKDGCCCAPFGGAGSPSNAVWPGPRSTSVPSGILIHPAVWPQRTWAKNWGLYPFWGAGSPSNTMWSGPRPISVPSGILIHPDHDRHGSKIGWLLCPFCWGRGRAGSPCNTVWPGLRPTTLPNGILYGRRQCLHP